MNVSSFCNYTSLFFIHPDRDPEDSQDASGQEPARAQVQGNSQSQETPGPDIWHRQDGRQPQIRPRLRPHQCQEDQCPAGGCHRQDQVESEDKEGRYRQAVQGSRDAYQRRSGRR